MKKALLYFLLICWCQAQGQAPAYYFKNYGVDNGISSNTITCILQDKKGFMWFGTRNGLNRFDGTAFRIYKNGLTDSLSIGNNSILSLFETSAGMLWVGTYKGIYEYDPALDRFRLLRKFPVGEVRHIYEDGQQNIWVVCDLTLYRLNQQTGIVKSFPFKNTETTCLNVSEKGTLWAATSNGMLKKFDPVKDHFFDIDISALLGKKDFRQMQDFYSIGDTAMLIGTMKEAFWLNLSTLVRTKIMASKPESKNIQVHKILRQSAHEYWIGTETGMIVYNAQTGSATQLAKSADNPYGLADNVIYTFCKDREGGTWIGTFFGGVNYHSNLLNSFQKFFPQRSTNSLSGNLVHEICSDDYGNIWIGTEDAGLNKLNPVTGEITRFIPNGKASISHWNIHGLVALGKELWIGTYEHGLDVMDIPSGKVIRHYQNDTTPLSLSGNFIVSLYKTAANEILVGTWNGLYRYNRATNQFIPFPFFNKQVQAIHEDGDKTIWAASYGNGVFYFNPKTGKQGRYIYEAGNANSIINNYVNNLFEDKEKNLWICTEAGLCVLNKITGKIDRFTTENGLPDNQIFKVIADDAGVLWISTAKGLASFNTVTKQIKTYTTANGLLTNQFNYNSGFKTTDGTLYFGSVKGLIGFKPASFIANTFVPPVYLTGLQLSNVEMTPNAENSPLSKSITYTQSITLPHNRSNISLDAAVLSYVMPEMNTYSFKMEGYDKDWITLKTNRRFYYPKLPPGEYTFMVKGASSDGVWNKQETKLAIKVLPPFWASWWAYLLYSLFVIGIVAIIFRYYHLAVTEKNKRRLNALEIEKEREIYNAKIEFFTNVAHEIRTPLTLIKMPLDKLLKRKDQPIEQIESLAMMNKNTNRLIDLTNQLLDFRKAEANNVSLSFVKTEINEFLSEIFTGFKEAANERNLRYDLELPRLSLNAFVDQEALRKIITNLLSNAIKYSDKKVLVRLLPFSSEDTTFTIEVSNDGYLIPYELKEKIFEPFYRLKQNDKQAGTGIGLPLSRSLAVLHKGVLDLKQPHNGLNIFSLVLPIHQDFEINLERTDTEPIQSAFKKEELVATDSSKANILLVEDNLEILRFIEGELKAFYNIRKANNGKEALDLLEKDHIQLVVSDIMMPVMDGIELCKRMKSDLQYSHIPIILLTAKKSLNSKIEGLEVGADAYIEKPFSFEHLQAQISNLLNNRKIIREYFANSPLTHIRGIACTNTDKLFLEKLNELISERITEMDLDVDKLAQMMNMSRPTFYRKIKGLSNLTPNELINLSRLKKAAQLLAEGTYKINEVAHLVGYSIHSNFARDFQKQFGLTPSAYVASLQNQ